MRTFPPSARAVAVVATLLCGAVAMTAPSAVQAQAANPCGPLGDLVELKLNDRCELGAHDPELVDAKTVVGGLAQSGLFATFVTCGDGTQVPVVARPDELIVTAGSPEALANGLSFLRERLSNVLGRVRRLNALAAEARVAPGTIDEAFLRDTIPTLQGEGFSVDLNYLEPAQPNNGFRPGDDPVEALEAPAPGSGGKGRVLVVDSPSERRAHPPEPDVVVSSFGPSTIYDVDKNGLVDEDHVHGVAVASLVKRLAPFAEVVLAGVPGQELRRSGRWTPMMFSDADLIRTLDDAFGLSPMGDATRRTYDIVNLSLGGAGCDVAARLALGRFMRDLAAIASPGRENTLTYVAAAGNDGADVKHFPAAFRDKDTMELAAQVIDTAFGGPGSPAGNAVRQLNAFFVGESVAVGAWTGGVKATFSNCGEWVNGIATGTRETVRYRDNLWVNWSGTSFATPRVTAALVAGGGLTDVQLDASGTDVGGC